MNVLRILILTLLWSNLTYSIEEKETEEKIEESEIKKLLKDFVILKADKKKIFNKEKYWDLLNNVEIRLGEDRIMSHYIKYFPDKKEIHIKDDVQIISYKYGIEIFASQAYYKLDEKYGYMIGNPKIVSYENSITLLANKFEYFGEKNIYVAKENVIIDLSNEGFLLSGEECIYELENDRIRLIKNPKIVDKKKDILYSAKEIQFYIKDRQLVLDNEASIFLKNENIKITADRIDIFQKIKDKDKEDKGSVKLVMTGNVICYEYSSKESLMKGKPFRILKAKKMTYLNPQGSTSYGYLEGNARVLEYYVTQENLDNDNVKYIIKKRGGRANRIDYQLKVKQKNGDLADIYSFNKNVFIFDYDKVGFSDRAYFFYKENDSVFTLEDNAVLYDLLPQKEISIDREKDIDIKELEEDNQIEIKVEANKIKYFFDKKEWILMNKAIIKIKDYRASAEYIHYQENTKKGFLEGTAYLEKEGQQIKGSQISFSENDEKFVALGEAYYKNKDIEVWANEIDYVDKLKKAMFLGDVQFFYKKVLVNGNKLLYQKTDALHQIYIFGSDLYGQPKIRVEESILAANFIEYISYNDNDESTIYLDQNVKYESKKDNLKISSDNMIFYNVDVDPKKSKLKNKLFTFDGYSENELENDFYQFLNEDFTQYILVESNVIIEDQNGLLYADQGEYFIYPSKENEKFSREKRLLKGNCEFFRNDFSGRADRIFSFQEQKEKYLLNGNVELYNEKQFIQSELIYYIPYRDKNIDDITLIGDPLIEVKDATIKGDKVKIRNNNTKESYEVEIFENGLYKNSETHTQIKSDYFFYEPNQDILKARGNVNYFDSSENVNFYADNVSRYVKDKVSIISGNVQIKKGDENRKVIKKSGEEEMKIKAVIYGEQAKYNEETKELILIGNASFLDKENISVADKIVVDVKGENLKIISVQSGQYDIADKEMLEKRKKDKK